MIGKDEAETISKLSDGYLKARQAIGEQGSVPGDPSGYVIAEPSEAIKPFLEVFATDPLYAKAQEAAHEAGLTDKQFNAFMPAVLESWMSDDALGLMKPVDFDAELLKLVPDGAKGFDQAGQAAAAGGRVQDALGALDGLKAQKAFSQDEDLNEAVADYLVAQLGDDHRGIMAIETILGGASKIQPSLGGAAPGPMSAATLEARNNDPRNDPNSPQFDRAFSEETDRLFKEHYGDKRVA